MVTAFQKFQQNSTILISLWNTFSAQMFEQNEAKSTERIKKKLFAENLNSDSDIFSLPVS
jgi:hypothetical protein